MVLTPVKSHYRYVWSAAELQAKSENGQYGLRQCIRPLVELVTPGHDGVRPLSSYIAETVSKDLYRYQV